MGQPVEHQKLDLILATHNNLGSTIKCIESLYNYTNVPFNLTIVDDSDDITPVWIDWYIKQGHDNIQYIRPKEELTCGNQIINIGLKHTKSEIVGYLGNNVFVQENWPIVALTEMEKDPAVGIMGFKLLKYPTGVIEHAGIYFEAGMPHHMNFGVGEPGHLGVYFRELDIVGWALVLFKRAVYPEGLDEKTYIGFRGYDDLENCLDARKRGWKVFYCGMGCAYHEAMSIRKQETDKGDAEHEENRQTFLSRWGDVEDAKKAKLVTREKA
tara:strand:- start:1148 stop:1954 length:807 start_codon:yes stop_codon:yes gene_type:complete